MDKEVLCTIMLILRYVYYRGQSPDRAAAAAAAGHSRYAGEVSSDGDRENASEESKFSTT